MMPSTASAGPESAKAIRRPYVLSVSSHKGGTGRSTLALALAWLWGKRGLNVTLVDADPVKAASIVAANRSGVCPWENVNLIVARGGTTRIPPGQQIVIVDSPPLTEPLAQQVLRKADGVILCTLADSLCLNTLPSATRAVREAREHHPELELLGICVSLFNPAEPGQTRAISQLRGLRGGLFIEPPIPHRAELQQWPLRPGSDLPEGPCRAPLRTLADTLREAMSNAGWEHLNTRGGSNHAVAAHR